VRETENALHTVAQALKIPVADVAPRVAALAKEVRDLKKQLAAGPKTGELSPESLLEHAVEVKGNKIVVAEAPGASADTMRQIIDQLRRKASPIAVLLGAREEGKVTLVAGVSRELEAAGIHAGKWVGAAAEVVGGRGGGKPDMAQAGGKLPDKLPDALSAATEKMRGQLAG
jgi:alanyl-tRNA synthetase